MLECAVSALVACGGGCICGHGWEKWLDRQWPERAARRSLRGHSRTGDAMQRQLTGEWRELHADPKALMCENIVLVMVGLPARGKSYISGAIVRHLRILGVRAKIFNAGDLRRKEGKAGVSASFFAASNQEAKEMRDTLAMQCCDTLLEWLRAAPPATSSIAVLDATNTTAKRRAAVLARCKADAIRAANEDSEPVPLRVIFLESICNNPRVLESNYEMKMLNDDYKGSTDAAAAALDDFKQRVGAYEEQYEPLCDDECQAGCDSRLSMTTGSVRIIDGGETLVCHRTGSSFVAAPVIQLLHAMHLTRRRIVLVREEEAEAPALLQVLRGIEEEEGGQTVDVICGDTKRAVKKVRQLEVLLSTATPHMHQCGYQCGHVLTSRALSEELPETAVYAERFPDLVRRMRTFILLLERLPHNTLVLCPGGHCLRVLLAHFRGFPEEVTLEDMPLPKGRVISLQRDHKGFSLAESEWPASSMPRVPTLPRMGSPRLGSPRVAGSPRR